jgi:hypothetical protein
MTIDQNHRRIGRIPTLLALFARIWIWASTSAELDTPVTSAIVCQYLKHMHGNVDYLRHNEEEICSQPVCACTTISNAVSSRVTYGSQKFSRELASFHTAAETYNSVQFANYLLIHLFHMAFDFFAQSVRIKTNR